MNENIPHSYFHCQWQWQCDTLQSHGGNPEACVGCTQYNYESLTNTGSDTVSSYTDCGNSGNTYGCDCTACHTAMQY